MAPSSTPRRHLHWLLAAGTTWLVAFGCGEVVVGFTTPDDPPRTTFDKHLRRSRARVIMAGHDEPVRAG